jgi:glycine cleavage system H lipoate-binding protein
MVALFVILFVLLVLGIDLIIQARSKTYPLMAPAPSAASSGAHLRVPKDVFFHPGHTWARLKSGDSFVVGIDDFVHKALGGVQSVALPRVGALVEQGEPVITIEHNGKKLSLVSPVSGTIYAINTDALENPALIGENPYDEGWLFAVEPSNISASLSMMRVAEEAANWVRREIARFREFLVTSGATPALGEALPDGGVPVQGSLDVLDTQHLHAFEEQFLR